MWISAAQSFAPLGSNRIAEAKACDQRVEARWRYPPTALPERFTTPAVSQGFSLIRHSLPLPGTGVAEVNCPGFTADYGVEPICRVLPIAPATYYGQKESAVRRAGGPALPAGGRLAAQEGLSGRFQ